MTEAQIISTDESEVLEEAGDSGIVRFFRFLLRIMVVVLFGILLGTAVYLGVPAIHREFVEPVQVNSRAITTISRDLDSLSMDLANQGMVVSEIEAMLESTIAAQRETIAELTAQVAGLEGSIADLEENASQVARLENRLEQVEGNIQELDAGFNTFTLRVQDANAPVAKFSRQLQLIKAMELITRARFWFVQDNLGKASEDVRAAKQVVEVVLNNSSDDDVEILTNIVGRLDQALSTIELTPVVAADDLEIVWQFLILATAP